MTTKNDEIERLFRKRYLSSLRLAVALVHDAETARDIVHDVFASLLAGEYREISEAYLSRAVRNSCLNYIRDLSARDRLHNLYLLDVDECEAEDWPDEETFRLIAGSMSLLPSDQCRRVVDLRYRLGMKYSEIAEAAGISEVSVYRHLRHALEILRQTLRNE